MCEYRKRKKLPRFEKIAWQTKISVILYTHENERRRDMHQEVEQKVRDNFQKAFEQSLGEELPSADDDEDDEDEE